MQLVVVVVRPTEASSVRLIEEERRRCWQASDDLSAGNGLYAKVCEVMTKHESTVAGSGRVA